MTEPTVSGGVEKSVRLPLSRIRRMMKLDPDVHIATSDSVLLITKATELFLLSLAQEAYQYTASESKKTVTKKHVEAAINDIDALCFLDGTLDS